MTGTRCDWQAVGEALAARVAHARSMPFFGEAPSGSQLAWQACASCIQSAVSVAAEAASYEAMSKVSAEYFLAGLNDIALTPAQDAAFAPDLIYRHFDWYIFRLFRSSLMCIRVTAGGGRGLSSPASYLRTLVGLIPVYWRPGLPPYHYT